MDRLFTWPVRIGVGLAALGLWAVDRLIRDLERSYAHH